VRLSAESQEPQHGPLGCLAIADSRRVARHLRASPSRILKIEAEPAGGEAAIVVRLFARNQCRQLERFGDRHAADLSSGHLREDEVVVFQRPPEDRSRMALRGRRSSSSGPRRRSEFRAPLTYSRRRESEGSRRPSRVLPSSPLSRLWSFTIVSPRDSCCKASQERSRARLYAAANAGRAGWFPPKRSGNVTPTGEAAELTCREDLVSRGPAFGPCGWPNASGGERMAAAPALAHFCHCAATRSSGPSSDLLPTL